MINELRIGNKLLYIPHGFIISVRGIDAESNEIKSDFLKYQEDLKDYEKIELFAPVPLTSEILEACEFNFSFGDAWKKVNIYNEEYSFENENDGGWFFEDLQLPVQPKFLHQLQNLFFDLTGEELEYSSTAL